MANKVAIVTNTMNRPEFLFRQFEFYELMNSPHPVYLSDSSNPENAAKIKEGIKNFKKLNITYRWAPPGKDYTYELHPLIKEKYCTMVSDDDLVLPDTITECADFLESNSDYATCSGWQVSFTFDKESFNKPYGKIIKETVPYGRAIEDDELLARIKSALFVPISPFICFAVRRMELELAVREATKHFGMMEDMLETSMIIFLLTPGKYKVIDKLGYFMQRSITRTPDHSFLENPIQSPLLPKYGKIFEDGFGAIALKFKQLNSVEQAHKIARWIYLVYLSNQYALETGGMPGEHEKMLKEHFSKPKKSRWKMIRGLIGRLPLIKKIYYKFYPPKYITLPESKYYLDYKKVKDFIEKNSTTI